MKKRWLWKRRTKRKKRRRHDLLASVVVEGKMAAEGGVGRREAGSRRCRHGYCWEGWAGAGEHLLRERRVSSEYFKLLCCTICACVCMCVYRWAS